MPPLRRTYTRVAVVQLHYQPAALLQRRSPLEEPLAVFGHTEGLLPTDGTLPPELETRYRALRQRIRQTYDAQLLLQRLQAILQACQGWGVRLVVFPEYSR